MIPNPPRLGVRVNVPNLERLWTEMQRLYTVMGDSKDWALIRTKEAEILAAVPDLFAVYRERDALLKTVEEVERQKSLALTDREALLTRISVAENTRDELKHKYELTNQNCLRAEAALAVEKKSSIELEKGVVRLQILVDETANLNPHAATLVALMKVLAAKLAPYPFCSSPIECVRSGRCERNPVCNE